MSKTIKILSAKNCKNCENLKERIQNIIKKHNLDIVVEKIENIEDILKYKVTTFPALIIDDVVTIIEKIPDEDEIIQFLTDL